MVTQPIRSLLLLALLALAGCQGIGPGTVTRDRFNYIESISDSWKRQMLQNLLKIRYADAPVFLDVTSVISGYSLTSGLNVGGQWADVGRGDQFTSWGGNLGYADHPTITYTPLSGDKFARSLMVPLPISGILYLMQAGYPADAVLRVCVNTVNGLDNASGARGNRHPGDPRFADLMRALREAQTAGALGTTQKSPKDKELAVMRFIPTDAAGADAVRKVRELLGLDPQAQEYDVAYGSFQASKHDIAIQSRSTLQVMIELASYIDVPAADIAEGRVYAPVRSPEEQRMFPGFLSVHSGVAPPEDAYVAVDYRNTWFWIDDRDVQSKVALSFLMMLFSLTETGTPQAGAPLVTIPAR